MRRARKRWLMGVAVLATTTASCVRAGTPSAQARFSTAIPSVGKGAPETGAPACRLWSDGLRARETPVFAN